MTLNDLKPGQTGIIRGIGPAGPIRRRLLELGVTPGTSVLLRRAAPLGDPLIVCLRGSTLAIRRAEARRIFLRQERSYAG